MPRFGLDPVYTGQDAPGLIDIPLSETLKATASETFGTSPTPSVYRADRVQRQRDDSYRAYSPIGYSGYSFGAPSENTKTLVPKAQAQAKIDAAGLTGHLDVPEEGEYAGALDLLIDYKTRELRNRFLIDRYQGGIAGGAARLGTALVTSLADPLNIATAFMPVVGEARYAQILGRAGTSLRARAGARAGVGAIEGTAGAAIVEPLIYQSQQQIQADYDAYDSLLNVGFGAAFGGALQSSAGGLADVFARRARVGAWAETLTPDGLREVPDVPEGFVTGGGTRFIEGDDYVRGAYAVADASRLPRPEGEAFASLDAAQLGESPYADSGAPILNPDGSLATGKRRLASVLDVYARGEADGYRAKLLEDAPRYGLDSAQVEAMVSPVLVRVQSAREAGRWAEARKLAEPPRDFDPDRFEATTNGGEFTLTDKPAVNAQESSEFGKLREVIAYDGEKKIGSLLYANDGTPPTIEVSSDYQRRGVATAMLKLAKQRGGLLGDAQTGISGKGRPGYRTDEGQAFRTNADESSVTLSQRDAPQRTVMQAGIAQAVNGDHVSPLAASRLDGTEAGVRRFLEERRLAEEAQVAFRNKMDTDAKRLNQELARFDPAEADKLDAEVKALEQSLREEIKAAGGNEADFDAVLAEMDELAEALDVESKALRGVSLCMLRGG